MDWLLNSQYLPMIALIVLWVLPWKGVALWKAARLSHKWWFIAFLVLNTIGILEIIYIFIIASKYKVETEEEADEPRTETEKDIPPQ